MAFSQGRHGVLVCPVMYGASGYNAVSTSPFPYVKVSAGTPGICRGVLVEPAGGAREHIKPAVVSPCGHLSGRSTEAFNKNKKICSRPSVLTTSKTIYTLINAGTTNIVI